MEVTLGEKYRDTVTGWEGTAIAYYTYMYGCIRIELEGMKDGEPKGFIFDEQRLEPLFTKQPITPRATSGGPRDSKPVDRG